MAKILLINPDPMPRVLPPLGISYIADNLIKNQHSVRMLDMGFTKPKTDAEWLQWLSNIDFVGVTSTTLIYFDSKDVIARIKSVSPSIPVIIGGSHPSLMPDFVIGDSGADAVIAGEGEQIMVEIANGSRKAQGIIYAPLISDIDSLPFPSYSYFDLNQYFKFKGTDRIRWSLPQPSFAMVGTRGCPYECTFCASKSLFGKRVRFRSVANIMQEVDYLIDTYKVKSLYFYDDTLTLRKSWMRELCSELKIRKLKWICGTRVDHVDEQMLIEMKNAGCKYISYGVESGSNRVLNDIMKKRTTIEEVERILKLTRKVGIGIIANYMFGLPGETEDDLKLTLSAVKRIPADAAEFSIFIPLPGTELAGNYDWTKYSSRENPYHAESAVHSAEFAKIVNRYHKAAIKSFYFSPAYLLRQSGMIFRPKQLFYAFKSLLRLVSDIL